MRSGSSTPSNPFARTQDDLEATLRSAAYTPTSTAATPPASRRLRQFVVRHDKSRAAVEDEARRGWDSLVHQAAWSRSAIARFTRHRDEADELLRQQRAVESVWDCYLIGGAAERLLVLEEAARQGLYRRQGEQRAVAALLTAREGAPLRTRHAVAVLALAERKRRAYLYQEELRGACELCIPGYEPGHLALPAESGGDAQLVREKVDYLRHECCPYAAAEDCPFLPRAMRHQLGRQQAANLLHSPSHPGHAGAQSPATRMLSTQRQAADSSVQLSMRAVMKKSHYQHSAAHMLHTETRAAPRL